MDSSCIYYQRVFRDGNLDPQIAIYRDAENGPCEVCVMQEETWRERVIDEVVVDNQISLGVNLFPSTLQQQISFKKTRLKVLLSVNRHRED